MSNEQTEQLFNTKSGGSGTRLSGNTLINQQEYKFGRKVALLNGSANSATSTLVPDRNGTKANASSSVTKPNQDNNINVYHQAVDMYSSMKGREQ